MSAGITKTSHDHTTTITISDNCYIDVLKLIELIKQVGKEVIPGCDLMLVSSDEKIKVSIQTNPNYTYDSFLECHKDFLDQLEATTNRSEK